MPHRKMDDPREAEPWVAVATRDDDSGFEWVEVDVYIGGHVFEVRARYPFGGPMGGVHITVDRAGPDRVVLCDEAVPSP